ncbi:GTP-binding protein RAD-like [Mya arenaria]|uniref:GTP-binding protein RAD-like n=1 Tax=Mya arenaria TaxID=6604 RepID=UPI0022E8AC0E|nr:GTP-binding protein RAD-like [Mya arenaria]XP_052817733.1 GTP-binding protein RAD-like [Mya arenaria]
MECPIFLNVEPAENDSPCSFYCDNLFVDDTSTMRRHSMPPSPFRLSLSSNDVRNPEVLRRVRSFKTTSKGVVNKGDIYRKRGSVGLNVTSGLTVTSSDIDLTASTRDRSRLPSVTSQASSANSFASSGAPSYYRVLVLGSPGVGKSALINQFMSSENNTSDDMSATDSTVSVMLDGEESLLEFCNYQDEQFPEEDINVDAYMVVFSITDKETYDYAVQLVRYLRNELTTDKSIFFVGNKTDLVRKRTVEKNDARLCASYYNCKYVETSASLNHHVDNLLVGILTQIRLKLNPNKLLQQMEKLTAPGRIKHRHGSLKSARSVLQKLFNRQKSLSCDHLYDL